MRAGPALLVCALALAACVRRANLPEPVSPLAATPRAAFPAEPSVARAEPVRAPPITDFQLENGLSVVVLERPDLDWVSIRYTARRGAEDGTHAQLGAASMVMALAMLAPQAGGEPVAPVGEPGAPEPDSVIHGYVDRVAGHVVTSSVLDELDATLGELAALIREPRVSTQAVRDVAFRQMDRIDAANFDALELARCHARQILYGDDHPLGQPMDGGLSELGKLTLGQLEEHHRFMFAADPMVARSREHASISAYARGFYLTREDLRAFTRLYLHNRVDTADPRVSPLCAADLRGMPPTIITTAGFDPLRDEAEAYAAALEAAGNEVVLKRAATLLHGFILYTAFSADATAIFREVAAQAGALLRREARC